MRCPHCKTYSKWRPGNGPSCPECGASLFTTSEENSREAYQLLERRTCLLSGAIGICVFLLTLTAMHVLVTLGHGREGLPPIVVYALAFGGCLANYIAYRWRWARIRSEDGLKSVTPGMHKERLLGSTVTPLYVTHMITVLFNLFAGGVYVYLTSS